MSKQRPYAEYWEASADRFEAYANDPNPTERISPPLFTDRREHGGVDAPGWCRKQARKMRKIASDKRKAYEHKRQQKKRKSWKQNSH